MDEQLKKRLLGAVVLLSLAVLLIPVFFGPDSEPLPAPGTQLATATGTQLPGNPPDKPPEGLGDTFIDLPLHETPGTQTAGTQTPGLTMPPGDDSLRFDLEPPVTGPATQQDTALVPPVTSGPIPIGRIASKPPVTEMSPRAEKAARPETTTKAPSEKIKPKSKAEKPEKAPTPAAKMEKAKPAPERLAKLTPREEVVKAKPQSHEATKPTAKDTRSSDKPRSKAVAPDSASGAWAVQVGSFNDKIKADILRRELQIRRLPAFIATARVEGKLMYRVRVGPDLSREQADRWRERLARDLNLNANVVKH